MQAEAQERDPVVAEVDVFLSQALSSALYLLQYPLRPAHLPLRPGCVQSASVRPEARQLRLELAMPPHGENYSRSRGEGYARDSDMAQTPSSTAPAYDSGLMDRHSLTSDPQPPLSHRYVAGVLKDGELHLCPLQAIVQLRPSLQHLDQAAAGRKRGAADTGTDGDTTESEGEEARPVTVRFARRDTGTSRGKRVSWSERCSGRAAEEGWQAVDYHPLTSSQADRERGLLFAPDDSNAGNISMAPEAYLDMLCPVQSRPEVRAPSEPPGGAVSLSRLKVLPVTKQVHDLLVSTGVLTLGQLCSLLQCGRGQLPAYLDALQKHGVLVQGCWVAGSHLLHPSEDQAALRSTRDYLLYCFTQSRVIARKDVAVITKVPHETVRQVLAPLTSGQGWEFKLPTDVDFIHKYSHIVRQQEEQWRKRLEELRTELGLSREQPKPKQSPGGSEESRRAAARRGTVATTVSVKLEPEDPPQQGAPSPPPPVEPASGSVAAAAPLADMKQEEVEPVPGDVGETVSVFCRAVLARGVHSLAQITSKLQVHQGTLSRGHPLGTAAVTESLVEEAVVGVGAVEVGQPCGVRLFALPRSLCPADQFRSVVLKLFQNHRWLRRKTLLEEMESECGRQPETKELSAVLKELAYSRGSQWYLLGT